MRCCRRRSFSPPVVAFTFAQQRGLPCFTRCHSGGLAANFGWPPSSHTLTVIVPCGINETATRFEFFYRQLPHVGCCVRLSRGSSRHCCPDPHCQPPHCCCARHGSWDALELGKAAFRGALTFLRVVRSSRSGLACLSS